MPTIQEALAAGFATAMTTLGDGGMLVSVEYHSVTKGSYDPATDTYSDTSTTVTFNALLYKGREDTDDFHPVTEDFYRVLVQAASLGVIEPKEADYMVVDSADTYDINKIGKIPGDLGYIFQVRKT